MLTPVHNDTDDADQADSTNNADNAVDYNRVIGKKALSCAKNWYK